MTHESESVASTATITYFENVGSGGLSSEGGTSELTDQNITVPESLPPNTHPLTWFALWVPFSSYPVETDIELRRWTFDFSSVGTYSVEIPIKAQIAGVSNLYSYAFIEAIIDKWDGDEWITENTQTWIFDGRDNPDEGTIRELNTVFEASNITASQIRVTINAQVIFDAGGWYSYFPEIIIYPAGISLDVYPLKISAITAGSSPVKLFANGNVYSLPLVSLEDDYASPLRIFDGVSVKAFKRA